jgi:hypothetical protein
MDISWHYMQCEKLWSLLGLDVSVEHASHISGLLGGKEALQRLAMAFHIYHAARFGALDKLVACRNGTREKQKVIKS